MNVWNFQRQVTQCSARIQRARNVGGFGLDFAKVEAEMVKSDVVVWTPGIGRIEVEKLGVDEQTLGIMVFTKPVAWYARPFPAAIGGLVAGVVGTVSFFVIGGVL